MLLAAVMIIIALVTAGISFFLYRNKLIENNGDMGTGITNIAATLINPDRIDEYIKYNRILIILICVMVLIISLLLKNLYY